MIALLLGLTGLVVLAAGCTAEQATSTPAPESAAGTAGDGDPVSGSVDAPAGGRAEWSIDEVLAADPTCPFPPSGLPIRVGYAADFSELGAVSDVPASEAARHLATLINCSGGVDGRRIETRTVDVGGSPLTARAAALELMDWQPDAIIGPRSTAAALRLLAVTDGRVPVLSGTANSAALADASMLSFLVTADDRTEATAAARFALDNGWRTAVGFSAPGPDFGFGSLAFAAAFEAGGGTMVGDFDFEPGRVTNFVAAVAAMAGSVPDVVYATMPAPQLVPLLAEIRAQGLAPAIISSDRFGTLGVDGSADDALEGIYIVAIGGPEAGGRAERLDRSFSAVTGFGSTSPQAAIAAADTMLVIVEAVLVAGEAGPDAIGRALTDGLEVEAISGTVTVGRPDSTRSVPILQLVDGKAELAASIQP